MTTATTSGPRRGRRWWLWLLPLGAIPLLAIVYVAIALKPYRIPTEAMEPTLEVEDRILARRGGDAKVGDVVVFHPPAGATGASGPKCAEPVAEDELCPRPTGEQGDITFVKRVVARGGDRIALRRGRVLRNGRPLDEPYVRACPADLPCTYPKAITVPDGHLFMLGDNRGQSDDSRFWGPIREEWVEGRVVLRYWPPGRAGSPD